MTKTKAKQVPGQVELDAARKQTAEAIKQPGVKTRRKYSAEDIVLSIFGFVGSRGVQGSTYWEWWSWFNERTGSSLEYRGTCTARWDELQKVGVLVPTEMKRSQVESNANLSVVLSRRGGRVFVLREGANILDWKLGDKRAPRTNMADAAVLGQFHRMQARWMTSTAKQREKLLLKLVTTAARVLNNPPKVELPPLATSHL